MSFELFLITAFGVCAESIINPDALYPLVAGKRGVEVLFLRLYPRLYGVFLAVEIAQEMPFPSEANLGPPLLPPLLLALLPKDPGNSRGALLVYVPGRFDHAVDFLVVP